MSVPSNSLNGPNALKILSLRYNHIGNINEKNHLCGKRF